MRQFFEVTTGVTNGFTETRKSLAFASGGTYEYIR